MPAQSTVPCHSPTLPPCRRAESDAWLASSSCACSAWWFNLCALGAASHKRLQRQLDSTQHKLACYERQELRPTGGWGCGRACVAWGATRG